MNTPTFEIKATRNTPAVCFDPAVPSFTVAGNSIPENAGEFYGPIIEQLRQQIPAMTDGTSFVFCLPYFNSSSLKAIYLLLNEIKVGMDQGKRFEVIWHMEEEDDFMSDAAETFSEMTGIPFTLKTGLLT
jgi:hypothetical protein